MKQQEAFTKAFLLQSQNKMCKLFRDAFGWNVIEVGE